MADGFMVYQQMQPGRRQAILELNWPISLLPGYQDLLDLIGEGGELAPVQSVFGRDGAVIAQVSDYSAFYDPFGAAGIVQGNLDTLELQVTQNSDDISDLELRVEDNEDNIDTLADGLTDHLNDLADPHQTLAALQTFSAADIDLVADSDNTAINVNGVQVDSGLHVVVSYEIGDIFEFAGHLPAVLGAAGNAEILVELIHDFSGTPTLLGSQSYRVGNTLSTVEFNIKGLVSVTLVADDVGVYYTAVTSTTTVDGSTALGESVLAASRTRKFSFKAYAP